MNPVEVIEGKVAFLDRTDVDTDQIIPKQFLKRIERTGFGEFLFFDWMSDGEIELEPDPVSSPVRTSAPVRPGSTRSGRSPISASRP